MSSSTLLEQEASERLKAASSPGLPLASDATPGYDFIENDSIVKQSSRDKLSGSLGRLKLPQGNHLSAESTPKVFISPPETTERRLVIDALGLKVFKPVRDYPPSHLERDVSAFVSGGGLISLFIHFVDDSYRTIDINPDITVQELILHFADKIDCQCPGYFSLCEKLEEGTDRWLKHDLTLSQQDITDKRHLFFKVKLFKLPAYDLDPTSLDLFYLQIKTAVLGGDYLVPETVAVLLATFQVQISVGNYTGSTQLATTFTAQTLRDYLPREYLRTTSLEHWQRRIGRIHRYIYGLTSDDAKWCYLAVSQRIPAFGAAFFPVIQGKLHVTLGIVEDGILFFKEDEKSNVEFASFSDILDWHRQGNSDSIAIRLMKVEKPNTDPIELRVRYDCTFQQANTMLELLDSYFQLYNPHMTPAEEAIFEQRQNDPRKQRASPIPCPEANRYLPVVIRSADPYGSKLDHWLFYYRSACVIDKANTFDPLLDKVDQVSIIEQKPLTVLDLSSTKLDVDSLRRVIYAFEKNEQYANLAAKQIHIVRNMLITDLNFCNTDVKAEIVPLLKLMQALQRCNLSNNNFTKIDLESFPSALTDLSALTEFVFSGNNLADKHSVRLFAALKSCKNILSLDLSQNKLTGTESLSTLLKSLARLEKLNLSNNKLGDTGVDAVVGALKTNSYPLIELDIGFNSFSKALSTIADMLKATQKLSVLRLAGNKLNQSSATILGEAMEANKTITCIDIGDNDFGKKGWATFIKHLQQHKCLETLEVSHGMDKYGWSSMYALVVDNCRIATFAFRANSTITLGLSLLCDPLKIAPCLRYLDLSGSELSKKDMQCISEIVGTSTAIIRLNLSNAKLADDALVFFTSSLAKTTSLMTLNLDGNNITDTGGREIANALSRSCSVQTLTLTKNQLTEKAVDGWLDFIRKDTTLHLLDLRGNPAASSLSAGTFKDINSYPTICTILIW